MTDLSALEIDPTKLGTLTKEQLAELNLLADGLIESEARRLFYALFPDDDDVWRGPTVLDGLVRTGQTFFARHKYPRHTDFFAAGAQYRERCLMAANRVGKTFSCGGYEMAAHLTGLYPDWWPGRRFTHPISAWAAGDTNESTRDVIQLVLLGSVAGEGGKKGMDGRGVIPGHLIGKPRWKAGVQDLVDTVAVEHVSGGMSRLGFKSFDQGRKSFQGAARHVIWLDEEPPHEVYEECLIRTATTGGIIMLTFTPLSGMSEVVMSFLPKEYQFA